MVGGCLRISAISARTCRGHVAHALEALDQHLAVDSRACGPFGERAVELGYVVAWVFVVGHHRINAERAEPFRSIAVDKSSRHVAKRESPGAEGGTAAR